MPAPLALGKVLAVPPVDASCLLGSHSSIGQSNVDSSSLESCRVDDDVLSVSSSGVGDGAPAPRMLSATPAPPNPDLLVPAPSQMVAGATQRPV